MPRLFAGLVALALVTSASAATLEVPANGGRASGIGYISGWKCPPNDNLTAVIDGGAPIPLASGVRRGDTAGGCGNDGRNGFIAQINFANLGDGLHTVSVRQNGVPFDGASFTVATFGTPFVTGATTNPFTLQNFPSSGRTARIQWNQGSQNFVIVDTTGSPPSPTPRPNPTATPRPTNQPSPAPTAGGAGVAGLIGTWDFLYTIISTFSDRYFLPNDIRTVNGVRTLVGRDEIGLLAIVARVQDVQPGSSVQYEFIMLNESILLCKAFFFNRSGNSVSGIYTNAFFAGDDCGTFFGEYPMNGFRISNSAAAGEAAASAAGDVRARAERQATESAGDSGLDESLTEVLRALQEISE